MLSQGIITTFAYFDLPFNLIIHSHLESIFILILLYVLYEGLLDEMLSSMCEPLRQLDGSEADPGYRVRNYWRENFTNLCLIKEKIRIHINFSIECFFFRISTVL